MLHLCLRLCPYGEKLGKKKGILQKITTFFLDALIAKPLLGEKKQRSSNSPAC